MYILYIYVVRRHALGLRSKRFAIKTSFGCSRFSCFNIRFAGGTGPLWIPVPTKLFHNGGSGD